MKAFLKKNTKRFLISLYAPFVKRFLHRNEQLKLIGISGSVGKTSTKSAVSAILQDQHKDKVITHRGFYNDPFASIFILLSLPYPNLKVSHLIKSFFSVVRASKSLVKAEYAVLEIGTDAPGEIKQFGKFLNLDYCIITAITPEHTVNFKNLTQLYEEELAVARFSKNIIASRDLIERRYQSKLQNIFSSSTPNQKNKIMWFGTSKSNSAVVSSGSLVGKGTNTQRTFNIELRDILEVNKKEFIRIRSSLLATHNALIFGSSLVLSRLLKLDPKQTAASLQALQVPRGRGRLLRGLKGSLIIDDSYNNVGANVSIAALDLLYEIPANRKIAVLGGINEVSSDLEKEMHEEVAFHIKAKRLQEVVLIGRLAKQYYQPIIHTAGLKYKYFATPYKAGEYLKEHLVSGMAVLVKGSQNGIYSEETIPPLLQNPKDKQQLVRQSPDWLTKKRHSFKS